MEYILFIHKNTSSSMTLEEWNQFFVEARNSGMFSGGSEIANRKVIGKGLSSDITDTIGGYMRFQSDSFEQLKALLSRHPVVKHGGTVELCELPQS